MTLPGCRKVAVFYSMCLWIPEFYLIWHSPFQFSFASDMIDYNIIAVYLISGLAMII